MTNLCVKGGMQMERKYDWKELKELIESGKRQEPYEMSEKGYYMQYWLEQEIIKLYNNDFNKGICSSEDVKLYNEFLKNRQALITPQQQKALLLKIEQEKIAAERERKAFVAANKRKPVIIDGKEYEVQYKSDYDGLPVKNKLLKELKDRLLTEKQWLELGKQLIKNAEYVEMHPNAMNKKLCKYYSDSQVIELQKEEKMCVTCIKRKMVEKRCFCTLFSSFVNGYGRCEDWSPISDEN